MTKLTKDQVSGLESDLEAIDGRIDELEAINPVKTVNGEGPDANGNVVVTTGAETNGSPVMQTWVSDGVTNTYAISNADPNVPALSYMVTFDGIVQFPQKDFNIQGTDLVLIEVPDASTEISIGLFGSFVDNSSGAPTNNPNFTGIPTAPTASPGTNTNQLATTEFVTEAVSNVDISGKADKNSPALTGTPTAPTAPTGTDTNQIATTAFVADAISDIDVSGKADKNSPAFTGTPTAPTATAGTNTTQIATTQFVKTAIDSQVKGMGGFCSGTMTNSEVIIGGVSPYAITIVQLNCSAVSTVASAAQTILSIQNNGTEIGTITFAAGSKTGNIVISTPNIAVKDFLTIVGPAMADPNLANIAILLRN